MLADSLSRRFFNRQDLEQCIQKCIFLVNDSVLLEPGCIEFFLSSEFIPTNLKVSRLCNVYPDKWSVTSLNRVLSCASLRCEIAWAVLFSPLIPRSIPHSVLEENVQSWSFQRSDRIWQALLRIHILHPVQIVNKSSFCLGFESNASVPRKTQHRVVRFSHASSTILDLSGTLDVLVLQDNILARRWYAASTVQSVEKKKKPFIFPLKSRIPNL